MEIRVNVPDELVAQAQTRGMRLEEYVERLLAETVTPGSGEYHPPQTTEQIRAWLDALAQFSDKIPALPQNISREYFYQDHD